MIVADVMTRNVISIAPEATVEEAAQMMLERRISGLFVVDKAGDLIGVITEGDLLHRDELGTERHHPWWLRLFISPAQQATEFTHAHGRHVRDVMTTDVVSVAQNETLETVVGLMEERRIKRVPVTQDDRVVGVVSRSDLLRALIGRVRHAAPMHASDPDIRTAILDALEQQSWAPTTTLSVVVNNGVVDIWGTITSESERSAIRVIAENAEGVQEVLDHMVYVEPYTGTVIESPNDRA
ncbi:MAG: CBS domain-containing protein [Rhodopila sp.]